MTETRWRIGSGLLVVVAVALFVLAFTRFDAGVPQPGSPGFDGYEDRMTRDARLSVVLGVAGCFALLGAFACHERARRKPAEPTEDPSGEAP
ncbi:MAG TPA: hypothetical protein VJ874_03900 [Candidatus Thermoplasmatota archaeon]|nr:hypothetical protein [Candidatus Thermoplasmatota archaeon]